MRTGIACLALSAGIVLYIYAAVSCYCLHMQNDKTAIQAAGLVAIIFAIAGLLLI